MHEFIYSDMRCYPDEISGAMPMLLQSKFKSWMSLSYSRFLETKTLAINNSIGSNGHLDKHYCQIIVFFNPNTHG